MTNIPEYGENELLDQVGDNNIEDSELIQLHLKTNEIFQEISENLYEYLKGKITFIVSQSEPFANGREGNVYKILLESNWFSGKTYISEFITIIKNKYGEEFYKRYGKILAKEFSHWVNEYMERTFGKEFIVVKKRYDDDCENEIAIQNEVHQILTQNPIKGVQVPKVFTGLSNKQMLVMEMVKGKTLYNKIIEKICEYEYYTFKHADQQQMFLEYFETNNGVFYRRKGDDIVFDFPNDTIAKKMFENSGIYDFVFHQSRKYNTVRTLKEWYDDVSAKIQVISKEDFKGYKQGLIAFLELIHDNGIFHRDLGGNPRNIMITDDGELYIIDFGWAKKFNNYDRVSRRLGNDSSPYESINHPNGTPQGCDIDESIIPLMSQYAKDPRWVKRTIGENIEMRSKQLPEKIVEQKIIFPVSEIQKENIKEIIKNKISLFDTIKGELEMMYNFFNEQHEYVLPYLKKKFYKDQGNSEFFENFNKGIKKTISGEKFSIQDRTNLLIFCEIYFQFLSDYEKKYQ